MREWNSFYWLFFKDFYNCYYCYWPLYPTRHAFCLVFPQFRYPWVHDLTKTYEALWKKKKIVENKGYCEISYKVGCKLGLKFFPYLLHFIIFFDFLKNILASFKKIFIVESLRDISPPHPFPYILISSKFLWIIENNPFSHVWNKMTCILS